MHYFSCSEQLFQPTYDIQLTSSFHTPTPPIPFRTLGHLTFLSKLTSVASDFQLAKLFIGDAYE